MQFLLYRFMRRHNVSPHEPAGSSGLSGMLVSALTAPIYARSLIKVVLRRKLSFNVTAKGSVGEPGPAVDLPVLADVGDRAHRPSWPWRCIRHRPYPMMIGLDRGHPRWSAWPRSRSGCFDRARAARKENAGSSLR